MKLHCCPAKTALTAVNKNGFPSAQVLFLLSAWNFMIFLVKICFKFLHWGQRIDIKLVGI